MVFTTLVPEYLIGKAVSERLAANAGVREMKDKLQRRDVVNVQWDEIHVYMANMGYFVVDFSDVLDNYQGMNREPEVVSRNERL